MNSDAPWAVLARSGDPSPGSAFVAPCFRIPALAVTASGRVLAAWDVRADWRDLPGPFDLVVTHSDDHGRTWTPPRPLRLHEASSGVERGFGDASLLVTASGRVLCFYAGSTGESFFSAAAGRPGLECWLATSDDDGLTWTHRLLDLRPDGIGGMFAASGNGVRLSSGRLLQPFVLRRPVGAAITQHELDAGEHYAAIAHSDDGGDTWTLGPVIGPDCDENKVVETPTGEVLLHARARPRRRWATSPDGETFTRPTPHPDLTDPGCNGGLARWGDLLACSLLDDERERRRLVVRLSSDAGRTWSPGVIVDAGGVGYSVLAELADGELGILYEAGDYDALIFRRLTRADLGASGGVPTLVARDGSGAARPPEVAP